MSASNNILAAGDGRYRAYGITLLRVIIGVVFFMHGELKFFSMGTKGVTGFFTMLGIPFPGFFAVFIPLLEMLGGLALIVGFFWPIVCLALAADMACAIWFAKRHGGFFAPKGSELELTLLVSSLALALTGPGAFAVRNMIGGRRSAGRN